MPKPKPARQRRTSITIQERTWPFNPAKHTRHIPDLDAQRKQLVTIIDHHGFDWQVFAVAASGFFTDSYNLFAGNVILPCLAYVYWPGEHAATREIAVNALTLAGSVLGQLLFGYLADRYGRQRLYGVELVIVIFSTIGLAQASRGIKNGDHTSMSFEAWLMAWRFFMGIGIGAEYPLSACITTEWAATKSRGRMMSAVFLMQPLGQLMAWVVGLSAITGLSRSFNFSSTTTHNDDIGIDILWRIVVGVGAVPAAVAILFRWTIPESGRYTYDVRQDGRTAIRDTRTVYDHISLQSSQEHELDDFIPGDTNAIEEQTAGDLSPRLTMQSSVPTTAFDGFGRSSIDSEPYELPTEEHSYNQFAWSEIHSYFIKEGNWRYLAGTSLAWFLLDFAFYGLGFNNPGTMAKLWTSHDKANDGETYSWRMNSPYGDDATIHEVLLANGKECILTSIIASICGSVLVIMLINKFDRRKALVWSFLLLASALLVLAILFLCLFHTKAHDVLIVFYAIVQFGFAFGPNTLLFIIPAEIFPTRYRCTCYGIAAAMGKLGAVFVQVAFQTFDNNAIKDPNSEALGYLMFIFAGFMAIGAVVSWAWIPTVQEREDGKPHRLKTRTLERLGAGRSCMAEGERVGFRARRRAILGRVKQKERSPPETVVEPDLS